MAVQVIAGDCIREVARLPAEGVVVDAVVTDPPYHLIQNAKRFGRAEARGGFMGKAWDGGDIAFRPETWAAIGVALKPGGYLLAFGGTRTHHRVWCAIEDAGFVIQDTIMWLNGQGFPKGRDQLKPAFEPICVAYKPGGKRSLQVDECRIGTEERINPPASNSDRVAYHNGWREDAQPTEAIGRWPANVCHDGSDEVMEAFAAFGERRAGWFPKRQQNHDATSYSFANGRIAPPRQLMDRGTAARFYYCAKASKADRAGSQHPTVKPIALMRWLVALVTPPGGLVLDPFAGSGATGAAAVAEGRNAILIEREPEYIADIRRRKLSNSRQQPRRAEITIEQHRP
jgi:site-specific DNA-methyltransferase (adenine-specific)